MIILYEAQIPLGERASDSVRHLYDIRTIRVTKVKDVSEKSDKH